MSNTDFQVLEKINQGMLKTFKKRVDGTMPAHTPTIIRRTNSESELIKDDIKWSKIDELTADYRLKNCVADTKMPIFDYPMMQFEERVEDFA